MSILAQYQNIIVGIQDIYTDGAGVKWASVEAQDGQPFIGGDKWPIRTKFATVKVAELSKVQDNGKPNLFCHTYPPNCPTMFCEEDIRDFAYMGGIGSFPTILPT